MKIMKFMNRIPGGLVIVPMVAVSVIFATFFPGFMKLGGFTSALFSSDSTSFVIAVLLFISGVQFDLHDFVPAMKRGGALTLGRLLIGILCEWLVLHFFGPDGFLGISALSIVIAMTSCNPGVYLSVCQESGDKLDIPGFGVMNLLPVPAVPILMLGAASGAPFDGMSLLVTIIPFLLGIFFGNIDKGCRDVFGGATPVFLIFLGVTCGATLDWKDMFSQVPQGILLSVLYFAITIPLQLVVDRFVLKRPGYGAVSMSSISGVSIIMPAAVAAVLPAYQQYTASAVAQLGLAVILTDLFSPVLIKLALQKWGGAEEREESYEQIV